MDQRTLQDVVSETAERLQVPGVAVGVYHRGAEHYAFHGVTSVENPLPVDEGTLFQFGSTGKTFTATAILRLVEAGRVDLDAPVRRYVPELRLADERVAADVTVLHLLNHTAGWAGDLFDSTGDGDDALARYVERMAKLGQETPLGSVVSYNNAALSLAGRVIEKVTGTTYEQAVRDLVLAPLGLDHSYFFPNEIMTRRFVVGHIRHPDGTVTVARPWALPRSGNPAGGISSNAGDQVAWIRFHLGDGRTPDGKRLLSRELLARMREPTADMVGSALGDHVGISWLLRDVDGVRLVSHGGTTIGQHSDFVMVPERDFGITLLTNCGPNGPQFNEEVRRLALSEYAGVVERDPEPMLVGENELAPYVGTYATLAVVCRITAEGGRLLARTEIKPEVLAELGEEAFAGEDPPIPLGLLPGDGDRFVVTDGPEKGMRGYFARGADGVTGVHLGGRLATRVSTDPAHGQPAPTHGQPAPASSSAP